ncbi:MAG: hypothetical protein AB1489_30820 [Acidobacteriota bacterium]
MSQVKGSGKTETAAKADARKQADQYCKNGWEQEGSWSCHQVSPGYWECDLRFHCKREEQVISKDSTNIILPSDALVILNLTTPPPGTDTVDLVVDPNTGRIYRQG